ncbi:MAG: hypothetical protein LUC45_08830 [Paraprevotella sp.]|nr:hypothetical protein [Paraprevotella sp.]
MKNLKLWLMVCAAVAFTACDNDDDTPMPNEGGNTQDSTAVASSTGFLIQNKGNESTGIDGDFSWVNYDDFTIQSGLFASANGRSLGQTPNNVCIYGSKIYTAVSTSNTIEICSKSNFKSIKQISFADNATLSQPRDVVGYGKYVYVSFYSGYVCKIDTASFEITGSVAVGEYPEKMAVANGKLYVPNSNYGTGTTVSEIDLSDFTKTRDITVPTNPVQMDADAQGNVYMLSSGTYDENWHQQNAAVYRLDLTGNNHKKIADATMMDIPDGTNTLYVVNSPYGSTTVSYGTVALTGGKDDYTSLPLSADAPAAIAADPITGNIVLTSYNLVDGYASYTTPGYANIYSPTGNLLRKVEAGIDPSGIYFFTRKAD